MIEEAVNHTPLEAELARQIDKLNDRLDTQQNMIQALSSVITMQVRV
jgi:hypothetical protein